MSFVLIALVVGVAVGIGVALSWSDVHLEIQREIYRRELTEKEAEVKYLRAFMADHVGEKE